MRGLVLSAACLGMSLGAHAAAGGTVHVSTDMLAAAAALSVMCVAAADARRSFGGILGVVLLSQLVLHLLAGAGGHHTAAEIHGFTPAMLASHMLAGVILSALLAQGERLVWALWRLTGLLPRVPMSGEPMPAGRGPVLTIDVPLAQPHRRDLCLGGPGMRAPPAGLST